MHSHTVGFVGGGRITAIFLHALGGRSLALERVTVSDTSAEVLAQLKARFPAIAVTGANEEAAALAPAEADRALRAMLDGAVRTFFDAGLTAGQVMDLVPIRPLAEAEPQILQAYQDVLPRLHAKLKGA